MQVRRRVGDNNKKAIATYAAIKAITFVRDYVKQKPALKLVQLNRRLDLVRRHIIKVNNIKLHKMLFRFENINCM